MAITNLYTLYGVNIAATSPVFLGQIRDWGVSAGISEFLEGSDGDVDARYAAVNEQRMSVSFTTRDIKAALDAAGISGRQIDVDTPDTLGAIECWFQVIDKGGTRKAGGSGDNHTKLTLSDGILLPRQLQASQGQLAEISYDALLTYDGSNNPIVIDTTANLSGTPGTSVLWTLGPVSINGAAINGVTDLTVDCGIEEIVEGSDGEVWPRYSAIMSRRPSITFRTPDAGLLNTLGITGAAQGASDSLVYLRKVAKGGMRVADGTAEHIKIAIDDGRITVREARGTHGERLGVKVQITPVYDGTNEVLAITTASAIT